MNMSEDVAGSVMQWGTKGVEVAGHLSKEIIDLIMKLLKQLADDAKMKQNGGKVKSTDLSDLKKVGKVALDKMMQNAKKKGEALSYSQNSVSEADMKYLSNFAKKNHFPISFVKSKDNNYFPVVAESDKGLLQMACTELVQTKIATAPDNLGNFKAEKWQIPFITDEINKMDVAASFVETKSGEYLCVFDKADAKLANLARKNFVDNCEKLKSDYEISRDEDGFYSIRNTKTQHEISFDEIPSKHDLTHSLKEEFGFDDTMAAMCASKFGEEMLHGEEKKDFFADEASSSFSKIHSNVELPNENPLTKQYECWYLEDKREKNPYIVYRNEEGQTAILTNKMRTKEMENVLQDAFGITDKKELDALIAKARILPHSKDFRTPKNAGIIETDKCRSVIQRKNFTGNITISNGSETQKVYFRFRSKRKAITELRKAYAEMGLSKSESKKMAADVFRRAESLKPQPAVDICQVVAKREEDTTKALHVTLECQGVKKELDLDPNNMDEAKEKIMEAFDVDEATAETVMEDIDSFKWSPYYHEEEIVSEDMDAEEVDTPEVEEIDLPKTPDVDFSNDKAPDFDIPETPDIPLDDILDDDEDMGMGAM